MYYNLEIYDRNNMLVNTFQSNNEVEVLKQYKQAMQYYYKKKNNYSPVIKKATIQMKPFTDEKEWKATIIFDDGVLHSTYKYYFNFED